MLLSVVHSVLMKTTVLIAEATDQIVYLCLHFVPQPVYSMRSLILHLHERIISWKGFKSLANSILRVSVGIPVSQVFLLLT